MRACMLSLFSCVQLFEILWTVAYQTPLSMGFSRQEYCSRLPFPTPGDLPHPGTKPVSLALAGGFLPLRHLGSRCSIQCILNSSPLYKHPEIHKSIDRRLQRPVHSSHPTRPCRLRIYHLSLSLERSLSLLWAHMPQEIRKFLHGAAFRTIW